MTRDTPCESRKVGNAMPGAGGGVPLWRTAARVSD